MSAERSQAFFQNAKNGAYRHVLRDQGSSYHSSRPQHPTSVTSPVIAIDAPDGSFRRQVPQNARLFNPQDAPYTRFGDQQASLEGKAAIQSEFLQSVALRELQNLPSSEELQAKENFRIKLERLVHSMLTEYAKDNVIPFEPREVRLKAYGSLANGFAVTGSDVDLLLIFPKDKGSPAPIEIEYCRMLEKVFLDEGHGARLLTQTRVPIMRVCERPDPELLAALKQRHQEWEEEQQEDEHKKAFKEKMHEDADGSRLPSHLSEETSSAAENFLAELGINPADIPLPKSPLPGHAHLEYKGDVGIQCDINFSNYVAIHNTALLRCYNKCDPRVRQMVLVVKTWAKVRKINSPYHGTLSSYGYVLMVLHYLMNVAQPPVIPNLQHMAQRRRATKVPPPPPKMCEGMDVSFFDDERDIIRQAKAGRVTMNREMLGSLLRGFFRYYSDYRGFYWTKNVISIRVHGGAMTKEQKGWTSAKWDGNEKSIRQRYLLAIEDPFETHHNIARTVGHSGIVAIRDEFRRALDILNNVQSVPGAGWQWRKPDGTVGEDLFEVAEDRGDLHKKDQDHHAERMKASKVGVKKASRDAEKAQIDQESERSNPTNNIVAGPAEANGKGTVSTDRAELTEQKIKPQGQQNWSAKRARKKHVTKDNKSVKAVQNNNQLPQNTVKAQQEATGSSTYQRSSDCKSPPCALPDWSNCGFDPTRYGRPNRMQTPPQTPRYAEPAVQKACLPIEPTPPSTPGPIAPKDVEAQYDDAWMFVPAPTLLDPGQLRDIHTIQRGGNGCMRLAEDSESSWGGGGRMGSDRVVQTRASSKRKGKKVLTQEARSDDVGSQWNEVVEGMVRHRRRKHISEHSNWVSGREVDAEELVGELPFSGEIED